MEAECSARERSHRRGSRRSDLVNEAVAHCLVDIEHAPHAHCVGHPFDRPLHRGREARAEPLLLTAEAKTATNKMSASTPPMNRPSVIGFSADFRKG